MFDETITLNAQSDAMHKVLQADLMKAYKTCMTFDKLRELECKSEYPATFPLLALYELSRALYSMEAESRKHPADNMRIYSIEFDCPLTTTNPQEEMFSVNILCQYKRFEAFIKQYGAVITSIREVQNRLHVRARVQTETLGWLELRCVYRREYLMVNPNSVFGDIDSLYDLFMIRASSRGWEVLDNAKG